MGPHNWATGGFESPRSDFQLAKWALSPPPFSTFTGLHEMRSFRKLMQLWTSNRGRDHAFRKPKRSDSPAFCTVPNHGSDPTKTDWCSVRNERMDPEVSRVRGHSLIPYYISTSQKRREILRPPRLLSTSAWAVTCAAGPGKLMSRWCFCGSEPARDGSAGHHLELGFGGNGNPLKIIGWHLFKCGVC